jgi:hypothetical protein
MRLSTANNRGSWLIAHALARRTATIPLPGITRAWFATLPPGQDGELKVVACPDRDFITSSELAPADEVDL